MKRFVLRLRFDVAALGVDGGEVAGGGLQPEGKDQTVSLEAQLPLVGSSPKPCKTSTPKVAFSSRSAVAQSSSQYRPAASWVASVRPFCSRSQTAPAGG